MTERSGLGASIGFADETTWGVPVAPTMHHFLLEDGLGLEQNPVESKAIVAGQRMMRSTQRETGTYTVGGSIGLELPILDSGLLLKHMLGGSSVADGSFTPADLPAGLTTQLGRPDVTDGTVHPFTYSGGKCTSWEIGFDEGEYVKLGLELSCRHEIMHRTVTDGVTTNSDATITSATAVFDESDIGKPISGTNIPAATTIASVTSATEAELSANATGSGTGITFTIGLALTAVSYTSGLGAFSYYDTSLTVAGSAFRVKNGTIAGDNALKTDRAFAGQRYMDEAIAEDFRKYTGTLNSEYFSDTAYRRFVTGTEAALVVTFAKGNRSLVFTMNVMFDGTTPKAGDRGPLEQELPYYVLAPTTDASGLTAVLDTSG